jgi:hypothetical protein
MITTVTSAMWTVRAYRRCQIRLDGAGWGGTRAGVGEAFVKIAADIGRETSPRPLRQWFLWYRITDIVSSVTGDSGRPDGLCLQQPADRIRAAFCSGRNAR